jgi:hypothetical protein
VSQAEHPSRLRSDHEVTVDDVRQLVAAATPHFALQLRNRIAKLIRTRPEGDPVRVEGERAISFLTQLGAVGEVRGSPPEPDLRCLPSVLCEVAPVPVGD